jgi:hypothetical protein
MKLNLLLLSAAALFNAATAQDPVSTAPVELLSAGNYVILTKTSISTVPDSAITGDIAVSPIDSTAMTGFSFAKDSGEEYSISVQIAGRAYAADYAVPTPTLLTTAVSDMEAAYTDAAGRLNTSRWRLWRRNHTIDDRSLHLRHRYQRQLGHPFLRLRH